MIIDNCSREIRKVTHKDGFEKMKSISGYKRPALVTLIAMLLLAIIAVPVSAGLTVSNAQIVANVTPGQTLTQTMMVSIASTDPAIDMSIQVYGVAQSLQGNYELLDATQDTSQYSARTFVSVDKSSLHLDPGGSENVTATIQVPQDVGDGGRYAIINIATKPVAGTGLGIITAADIPVFLTIQGSQIIQTGKITGVSARAVTSGQPVNILTNFQNTGNHHFKVQGQVTIKDAGGKTIGTITIPLTASSIIPGMTRQLVATLDTTKAPLAVGTYNIDSKVTLPDGTVLDEATGSFKVTSANTSPPAATSSTPSSGSLGTETPNIPSSGVTTADLTPDSSSTLQNGDGTISINFPQGAVTAPVQVSLRNYPIDQIPALPSGLSPASTCFRVDGLSGQLAKDASVRVKYTVADLKKAGGDASKLELARWDAGAGQWTVLQTSVDSSANTLVASSNQMSIWAVVSSSTTGMSWLIPIVIVVVVIVVVIVALLFMLRRRRPGKPVSRKM